MSVEHVEIELPDLADFQAAWLRHPARIKAIEGATGTGKTYVHEPDLFRRAHEPVEEGDEYWWIAPTLFQARAVHESLTRRLEAAGLLGEDGIYHVSRQPMTITTPAGGVLRFLTADNPDHLYGVRNVRHIVGDEFTRWRISVWPALLTVANKTGCGITLIGNYMGDGSAWHQWVETMQGSADFAYWRTPATEAVRSGIMPQERYDEARRTLPDTVFRALYLCEGSTDPSLLVDYAAVSDMFLNEHVPDGKPALTCDIALHGSDAFTVGLWSGMILKDVWMYEKREAKDVEQIIQGKATEHQVPRSRIVYDADGLGAYLRSYLAGAVPYHGGNVAFPMAGQKLSYQNVRAQCHFRTADAINARGLWIATPKYREEFSRQALAALRTSGQDAAGRWGIYPKDHPTEGAKVRLGGKSPDLFDMVVMRQRLELTDAPVLIESIKGSAERKRVSFKPARKYDGNTKFDGR